MPWPTQKKLKKKKSTVGSSSDLLRSVAATLSATNRLAAPILRAGNVNVPNVEQDILKDVDEDEVIKQQSTYQISAINKFSINKDGVSRAVTRFYRLPDKHPNCICMHFASIALQHKHVLSLIKNAVYDKKDAKIESIQFIDRNVRHATRGLENRWLIKMATAEDRDHLLKACIVIFNRKLQLRSYDEVICEELKDYQEHVKAQTRMYVGSKISTNANKTKDKEQVVEQELEMLRIEKEAAEKAEKERIRLLAILNGDIDPDEEEAESRAEVKYDH